MIFVNKAWKRGMAWLVLAVLVMGLALPVSAQQRRTHTVQAGETLASIAARYGVTMQSLVQFNGITNPNLIFAGQVLVIPPTGGPVTTTRTYTVKAGDTLKTIAARYKTTWQALAQVNQLSDPNMIFVGQVLLLPPVGGPVAQPPPSPPPVVTGRYIVQPGDTMFSIAARFGRNAWDIARANGITNLNLIFAGQVLVIP